MRSPKMPSEQREVSLNPRGGLVDPVHRQPTVWPWAIAIAAACAVAWLLHRSLFEAHAQSFDTMIYGRSLWGIANAEPQNTVLGVHWLAVHANFVMLVLSPLTALFQPATVLIGAQALALALTIGLASRDAAEGETRPGFVVAAFAFAITLGSPLVLNPFLFDARPDLIGVPLCLVGLLRIRATRIIDARSAAWLAASLLVREDFSLVVAPALVALPVDRERGLPLRTRWLLALAAVAYTVAYTLLGREFFGGAEAAQRVSSLTSSMFGAPNAETLPHQGEIVLVALCAAGGLALLGGRWSAPAWPGIAFLLAIVRLPEVTLNSHYAVFVAPGLCVAAVEGVKRLQAWPKQRVVGAWSVVLALSAACWLASSSAPGGRRFHAQYFDLEDSPAKHGRLDHTPFLVGAHALVSRIPDGAPAAIPYPVAGQSLDRAILWDGIRLRRALGGKEPLPDVLRWIAVLQSEYRDTGKTLVQQHGFRLVDEAHGWIALLSRDESGTDALVRLSSPAPLLDANTSNVSDVVVTRCATTGLRVQGVERHVDGGVSALLVRESAASGSVAGRAVCVLLQGDGAPLELSAHGGILNPVQLPVGRALRLDGGPTAAPAAVTVRFAVRNDAGQWILAPSEKVETITLR